ncbi:hypothetical protein [Pantoea anthophila]|uniref:hypothetical protein n=1 Tax=Pantoea anthophila TaxID=470931 RepID=UPI00301DE933
MEKNKSLKKEQKISHSFSLQLKASGKVKEIEITNENNINEVKAIGGHFKLNDDVAYFFYSEAASFIAINLRASYKIENNWGRSKEEILNAVNKYNDHSFGIKATLSNFTYESFDVELNVESVVNSNSSGNLPIKPMLWILGRSKNQIDTYFEAYFKTDKGEE